MSSKKLSLVEIQDRETEAAFNRLPADEQKRVKIHAAEIRRYGANAFFIETGSHADDPANYWYVIGTVMEGRF